METSGYNSTVEEEPRLSVLVVDDSEDSRELVSFFLSKAFDAKIHKARNGREAVDFLQRQVVDLVFLDLEMPIMDGYAAARLLVADPRTASVPLIAMTAHTGEEEIERALACGCIGYVAKPFTEEALVQTVLRHIPATGSAGVTYLPGTAGEDPTAALCKSYLESRLRDAREIPALLAAGDLYRIGRLAAVMQETGVDYGLGNATAIGVRLQRAVRAADRQAIYTAAKDLERMLLGEPGLST